MTETQPSRTKKRRPWLPLAFVAGLLLGWLVIGWWLWPVQWINVSPAQMAPEHQRAYVAAVAEAYALTGDVGQAQSRLSSWDDTALANTLSLLIQETADPLVRERYVELGEALAMPQMDVSLFDVILGQKAIMVTAVAAIGLFLAALGMAVFPSIRQAAVRRQEERRLLAGEEPGDRLDEEGETAVSPADSAAAPQPNRPAPNADGETAQPATAATAPPNQPGEPDANGASQGEAADGGAAAGQPGAVQTGNGQQPPQNPASVATPPPAQAATAVTAPPNGTPPPANNQQLLEESQEKQLTEAAGEIQELLNSIFEEDDKLAHYETLLRGLGDVDMDQLGAQSEQILRLLRRMNREGK